MAADPPPAAAAPPLRRTGRQPLPPPPAEEAFTAPMNFCKAGLSRRRLDPLSHAIPPPHPHEEPEKPRESLALPMLHSR